MNFEIKVHISAEMFWRKLMLFAYRRLCAYLPPGQKPVGVPGNRDPERPCTGYAPRPKELLEWNDCEGDGHYECQNCCHLKRDEEETEA